MNTVRVSERFGLFLTPLGAILLSAAFTGCSVNRVGLVGSPALNRHFAQGQVTDVTLSQKMVGDAQGLLGRKPIKQSFLEGYIEGALVEWDGTPAAGVVVRVDWEGWANPAPASADDEDRVAAGETLAPTLTPDEDDPRAAVLLDAKGGTAVTDKNGRYRVPFALPLRNGSVEAAGRLLFSPDWAAQLEKIGRAYEPFDEVVPFQLFYYHREKTLAYNEGFHRQPLRLRGTAVSDRTSGSTPTSNGAQKSTALAALWIDLQLTLVNNRLENDIALSKANNALLLALAEPTLFVQGQSVLTDNGRDILKTIAPWITAKRCRLAVSIQSKADPVLTQKRLDMMRVTLVQMGVPDARFITDIHPIASHGVTILLRP